MHIGCRCPTFQLQLLSSFAILLIVTTYNYNNYCMSGRLLLMVGARRMPSVSSSAATAATTIQSTSTSTVAMSTGRSTKSSSTPSSKILYIVRHGQAMHNPRAEAAKDKGCSTEEFFELMRQDDALDAELTDLGRQQAKQCHQNYFAVGGSARESNDSTSNSNSNPLGIDFVVASSLSRTIDTADMVLSSSINNKDVVGPRQQRRISLEDFREVNGDLFCAKRRTKSELVAKYPDWNFDSLTTEEDELWTPEMEKYEDTAERGYRGLVELLTGRYEDDGLEEKKSSTSTTTTTKSDNNNNNNNSSTTTTTTILLACHGGILRYTMNIHPLVHLCDERTENNNKNSNDKMKSIESRFDNCELRKYRLSWKDEGENNNNNDDDGARRAIVLTQLDH